MSVRVIKALVPSVRFIDRPEVRLLLERVFMARRFVWDGVSMRLDARGELYTVDVDEVDVHAKAWNTVEIPGTHVYRPEKVYDHVTFHLIPRGGRRDYCKVTYVEVVAQLPSSVLRSHPDYRLVCEVTPEDNVLISCGGRLFHRAITTVFRATI